jgi:hypothetical protein
MPGPECCRYSTGADQVLRVHDTVADEEAVFRGLCATSPDFP